METTDHPDGEARGLLLAAARARVVQRTDFTIAGLLAETGVSRTQFRRCFTGKKQLLAALTQDDARALGAILDVAQPVEIRRAVGSDIAPVAAEPAPTTDAWLERRLRVFERALAGLEKRQERYEQSLANRLAVMEENLAGLATRAAPQVPLFDRTVFDPSELNLLPADAPAADPVSDPAPSAADAPVAVEQAVFEQPVMPDPLNEPISEQEKEDFIARARQAVRNAMLQEPPPKRRRKRGLIWEAMLLSGILLGGLIVIGTVLLFASGVPQSAQASAIAHRQPAQSGTARIVALADNGDARAQTLLALAYLRSANDAAGLRWSQAAALQGQPVAEYLLGTLTLARDRAQAMRWLGAAAEQGNVKAMHNLAIAYAQGPAPDPALAAQWFTRAAALGYRDSQFDLAVLYERGLDADGRGVTQSGATALKWYLIAAAAGDAPSAGRAAILRTQIGIDDVRKATAEAAAFVPQAAVPSANVTPAL